MTKENRKAVGAAENNRNEVRDIIKDAIEVSEGNYLIIDRAGNKLMVNTITGVSGKVVEEYNVNGFIFNSCIDYESGKNSKKSNGYVYTPIVVYNTEGKLATTLYGTHSLVAMLSHTDKYDMMVAEDKSPVTNHKNNIPWDNRESNLEWVTSGGNNRHGKIISTLHGMYSGHTYIENNLSNVDFVALRKPLSVTEIERYVNIIGDGSVFKCDKDGHCDLNVMDRFIAWLESEGSWAL